MQAVVPCSTTGTASGIDSLEVATDCNLSKAKAFEYLGKTVSLMTLYNHASFKKDEYDDRRVTETSTLNVNIVSPDDATWAEGKIQRI